jgi:hypothetical protein
VQDPDHYGVVDPRVDLPAEIVPRVQQLIVRAVVDYRTTQKQEQILDGVTSIFKLLRGERLQETYATRESIQDSLKRDAALALKCALWIYKEAGGGRVPSAGTIEWVSTTAIFEFRETVARKLSELVNAGVTEWWRARLNPSAETQHPQSAAACAVQPRTAAPLAPTPHHADYRPRERRATDTPTARLVEQFRRRIEAEDKCKREVLPDDMSAFMGYADVSSLQRVCREGKNASKASITNVKRMVECSSADEFWKVVKLNREKLKNRRQP